MLVAAVVVPRSFERSLMPRSAVDQGLITGLSLTVEYGLTAMCQDLLDLGVARVAAKRRATAPQDLRGLGDLADLAAIGLGIAAQALLPPRQGERLWRGACRTSGWLLARSGLAGLVADALQEALGATASGAATAAGRRRGGRLRGLAARVPAAIPAGAAFSGALELWRRHRQGPVAGTPPDEALGEALGVAVWRSLAVGVLVGVAVAALATAERALAGTISRGLAAVLPGSGRAWRPAAHALTLAGLVAAVYRSLTDIDRRIEQGADKPEPGFDHPPASPLVSGGPGSLVPFSTLSRAGRRHMLTRVPAERIQAVMGEPARQPIRVYVGLESAPTVEARVDLALDELDRVGALDRGLLLLISPTGTGYVNYTAVEAAEYLTRGDIASVTMQYSERPSPLSLDRVRLGRAQNRMLWLAIHERLYQRPPERRPRVAIFGESLGAHTSQDAFLHGGTLDLEALGIDRALWVGTPYGSGWKDEVFGDDHRPDVNQAEVGRFDSYGQWEALAPEQRERLRYVLVGHDDDAVTYFGPDLLLAAPPWLGPERPPGVPRGERWSPVVTFLQTLVDMKNSLHIVPGRFESHGHDYRADLARFVRAVYRLDATDVQMAQIEQALRRAELERVALTRAIRIGRQEAGIDTGNGTGGRGWVR
jgi:uncharacterized membrane protein